MDKDDVVVSRNEGARRFEAQRGGEVAGFLDYREEGGRLRLVHTEVDPRHEGQGVAGRLAQFALDSARRDGVKVVPSCSYVAAWIGRHPDYRDLVA